MRGLITSGEKTRGMTRFNHRCNTRLNYKFQSPELSSAKLRRDLSFYLRKMEMQGDRFLITRNGTAVAGLVTPWDLHALDEVDCRSRQEIERRAHEHTQHMRWLEEAREMARRGEDVQWGRNI